MRQLFFLAFFGPLLIAADFKAGIGRAVITPQKPILMMGYVSRNHAFEGVDQDLWAKALALEDSSRGRVVIVTMELAALPREMAEQVAARVRDKYGLERSRLVMNVSHTHSGPVLDGLHPNVSIIYPLTARQTADIHEYSRKVVDTLVAVIGQALDDLAPASVSFGSGTAGFAANRRLKTPQGIKFGVQPDGPVDHDVPVLKVSAPGGKLKAVLFGYACHNTTLPGSFVKISGDYAGFAQIDIEKANPGATALFMALCGADQNPNPHGTPALAAGHGAELAAEVRRVLGGKLQELQGTIRPAWQIVRLQFAPHTREVFEDEAKDRNQIKARHARAMLKTYEEGRPILDYPYPVQAIALGKDFTLIALGGEVVVDYGLGVKKEFGSKGIVVAGYSNDIMSYIPTARILKEGGHEAAFSMIPFGQPGPWDGQIEGRIMSAIRQVMGKVGRSPVR